MEINLKNLTIKEANKHLKVGDFSVNDLSESYIKIIEEKNPQIKAYLEVYKDWKEQSEKAQQKFKEGKDSILTGIPIALKDNILMKGYISSASSKILENYHATYDSTVVSKLKEHSPVFLGRTNMDEFAMGSSTENSAYGPTRNPIDPERVPGGSSGGSAAAVAMDGALVALGSDTGGSIRQPASFCGLVGLKPTYGRISRSGLIALGSSLDQIGPLTKTVSDSEIIFNAIKGVDLKDSTTVPDLEGQEIPKKIVIGVPRDLISSEGIDNEVKDNFENAVSQLAKIGYEIKDISLPHAHYALAIYYVIMPAEVSSNLARYDGVRFGLHKDGGNSLLNDYIKTRTEGFGKETRRRLILGTYVLSSGYYDSYYGKANDLRKLVISDFDKVFNEEGIHAVITPSTPDTAFKLGEKTTDPISMYMSDIFTAPQSIAGLPAMSVPSGVSSQGLPIGLQITSPYRREDILFKIGKDFLGEE